MPKKFNARQVEEIRQKYAAGATTRQLAEEYQANRGLIAVVLKGEYVPRED
jgi:hypothetical protein